MRSELCAGAVSALALSVVALSAAAIRFMVRVPVCPNAGTSIVIGTIQDWLQTGAGVHLRVHKHSAHLTTMPWF
jgi:hypothetical protein